MNAEVVIQNVTYEIHRSFVSNLTVADRVQEIITARESTPDSLTQPPVPKYNMASGSVPGKEVIH